MINPIGLKVDYLKYIKSITDFIVGNAFYFIGYSLVTFGKKDKNVIELST